VREQSTVALSGESADDEHDREQEHEDPEHVKHSFTLRRYGSAGGSERAGQSLVRGWNRRRRRLLLTTNSELIAIAAPASIGFSRPAIASGIAATL